MGDKKKSPPVAAPAPKQADAPVKNAAPPQPDPVTTPAPADKGQDFSDTPANAPDQASGPIKPFKVDPAYLPPALPGLAGLGATEKFKLTTDPLSLIDWSAMRAPFLSRGLFLEDRDSDVIERNWTFSFNQMVGLGVSPAIAAKVANIGTPFAYNLSLSRDYPTTEERFDKELEKTLAPGKSLGKFVVPIITPDTLQWAVKTVFNKDVDFHF